MPFSQTNCSQYEYLKGELGVSKSKTPLYTYMVIPRRVKWDKKPHLLIFNLILATCPILILKTNEQICHAAVSEMPL